MPPIWNGLLIAQTGLPLPGVTLTMYGSYAVTRVIVRGLALWLLAVIPGASQQGKDEHCPHYTHLCPQKNLSHFRLLPLIKIRALAHKSICLMLKTLSLSPRLGLDVLRADEKDYEERRDMLSTFPGFFDPPQMCQSSSASLRK